MKTQTLLDETRQLLANRGALTLPEVADGAGVGLSWLQKFHQGRIANPTVIPLQKLNLYLRQAGNARA